MKRQRPIGYVQEVINKVCNFKFSVINLSKHEQIEFMKTLGYKKDLEDITRSYYQYLGQCHYRMKHKIGILNIAALLMLPVFIIYALLCGALIRLKLQTMNNNGEEPATSKGKAVIIPSIDRMVIPDSLRDEYNFIKYNELYCLTIDDLVNLFHVLRSYPLSTYFLFKIAVKVACYRTNILCHNPDAFVTTAECSYASSYLTKYCEKLGILHINVMHGEKLFDLTDSFFRFHRCYIWDEHYMNLFNELGADSNQFIVEIPQLLKYELQEAPSIGPNIEVLTYYLTNETPLEMEKICDSLAKLPSRFKIYIRPHPFYTDKEFAKKVFSKYELENNVDINIRQSLSRAKYIVSTYSTVLLQAYYCKRSAVIDDLSFPNIYATLVDLDYIMVGKNHYLLSDIIEMKQ